MALTFSSRLLTILSGAALLLLAVVVLPFGHASVAAAMRCRAVEGRIVEQILPPPVCTSPVGFCTQGTITGDLQGSILFTAASILPTADTPITSMLLFTGDVVIETEHGNLINKNAGAFRTSGDGEVNDLEVVVGGTGDFADASGTLQVIGTFVNGIGQSRYVGKVCRP